MILERDIRISPTFLPRSTLSHLAKEKCMIRYDILILAAIFIELLRKNVFRYCMRNPQGPFKMV